MKRIITTTNRKTGKHCSVSGQQWLLYCFFKALTVRTCLYQLQGSVSSWQRHKKREDFNFKVLCHINDLDVYSFYLIHFFNIKKKYPSFCEIGPRQSKLSIPVLLDEASQRPDETLGTVLIVVRAIHYPAEPYDVTPPPGLVTEYENKVRLHKLV